jgi:integrase
VIVSLRTQDLSKAQSARWPLVADYSAQFDVLRGKRQHTPQELEREAEKVFAAALQRFAKEGLTGAKLEAIADEAEDRLQEHGASLSELEQATLAAAIYAVYGRRAALAGKPFNRPPYLSLPRDRTYLDPVTLEPIIKKTGDDKAVSFADAARRYLDETQRDPTAAITAQTKGQYEAVYRLFDSWADKATLDSITRENASAFLDVIAKLEPNWGRSPETKRRTFSEVYKLHGDKGGGLSNRTVNRYSTALGLVWTWARRRGLFKGDNPWTDQQRQIGERRKLEKLPFTAEELGLLLKTKPEKRPKTPTVNTTIPWLSWIAAYSGMRLNEICSLKIADLKREKGTHYFDVTGAKTEAGDRRVPIHSTLIALGLLDYAKTIKGDHLWPALKPGGPDKKRSWYVSKRFTELRRRLGVSRPDERGEDRIDFHSFRRSVISTLENARVPQSEVAQVVGHERAGITFSVYNPHGLSLGALRDVVEKIKYKLPTSRKR